MPHLRKVQKQEAKRKKQGNGEQPEVPRVFNSSHLIQLDSLQEIAQRGKASSTKLIYQEIMDRRKKAEEVVQFEDLRRKHAGLGAGDLRRRHTLALEERQKR